jgi:RNA polymerase sigma-70 factor (ECF subfamily)
VDEVSLEETVPAAGDSPEDAVIGKDLHARVAQLVEQLPEAQKSAITLFFFDDLKCSEIAVRSGVPVSTVKTRLHYGIKALRVRLQADATSTALSERSGTEV